MFSMPLGIPDEAVDALAERVADRITARLQEQPAAPAGWLDAKEAAVYAGCSVSSLHKAMAAREIEFSQSVAGGKAWFRREWIDAWRDR
jgi:hypothetical protein